MAGGGVASKEMTEGAYKGKTISLLAGVDGNRLIKDIVSTDPNKMHTVALPHWGATGSCWTQERGAATLLRQILCNGYRAKAFKPLKCADCTGLWAGRLFGTNKSQSVFMSTTCTKIIYDKHLHVGLYLQ